ncbi:hypothetical protein [Specibacter sp. NPDC078709]|uniref:hypothetical protein n=1 Tax=Specibacter sp. NPDC078709 TaxID=3154364 RepID=UPI00342F4491
MSSSSLHLGGAADRPRPVRIPGAANPGLGHYDCTFRINGDVAPYMLSKRSVASRAAEPST